ncbi:MAG TPA: DUF3769 domain-containing protein [Leptolyngbyaceae cyanobacterium M33_DOE_097]|uniref:DUF3769 domain-containing protein n=1 Tax=Oscillatoriales cyanobacterium SpSt-418 TaxID=2282169 RepID=A0A7C3PSZ2_9CYAN|nr:DUF3769 domain-containing protein [Leptolyngbyaceae cyanobacterium M33_DOE_097]
MPYPAVPPETPAVVVAAECEIRKCEASRADSFSHAIAHQSPPERLPPEPSQVSALVKQAQQARASLLKPPQPTNSELTVQPVAPISSQPAAPSRQPVVPLVSQPVAPLSMQRPLVLESTSESPFVVTPAPKVASLQPAAAVQPATSTPSDAEKKEITDGVLKEVLTKAFPWEEYRAALDNSGLDQEETLKRLAAKAARKQPIKPFVPQSQPQSKLKAIATLEWGQSFQSAQFIQAPGAPPDVYIPTPQIPGTRPPEQQIPVEPQPSSPSQLPSHVNPGLTTEATEPKPRPQATQAPTPPTSGPPVPPGTAGVLEVTADSQEYDSVRQVFTATGNVSMRFQGALLEADRVQVNLVNRQAVAEGKVSLVRGNQILRGGRFEYNFVQGVGTVLNASGEINLATSSTDFLIPLGSDTTQGASVGRPLSDRLRDNQPQTVQGGTGGFGIVVGGGRDVPNLPGATAEGGQLNRLRFEAEQIDFTPRVYTATKIRITNDPFSPPELFLRAEKATITRVSPLVDEVVATRPFLVFDNRVAIPIIARTTLDRRQRQPAILQFGFDEDDRGGLFVFRSFDILRSPAVNLTVTPEIYLQRMFFGDGGVLNANSYGLKARFDAILSPTTAARARATLNSLDPRDFDTEARASFRLNQTLGTHTLAFEASYRDRLFNNSLGFQTVQSSIGLLFYSPVIPIGKTGINLSYQVGYQNITADTDQIDLLEPIRDNNRVNLSRFQGAISLSRAFAIWRGQPLPATPTQGLRYTPTPVVPYVTAFVGVTGVSSLYSNGDTQNNLIGSVGVIGQFGRMSRNFLDYTGFNITYIQLFGSGESPFLFDRTVDNQILSFGLVQQIYGPFRIGFQTAINVENGDEISTDFILEYSRRTYGIVLRYNPVLEIGSLNLRVSDFNWSGGTDPFEGTDITPVEGGVRRNR